MGQETAKQLHENVSQACAKNGGRVDKELSKLTLIHIKTGNVHMYNTTLMCIHATTVAVEKQEVSHILSVCLKAQVSSVQCTCATLYCHL